MNNPYRCQECGRVMRIVLGSYLYCTWCHVQMQKSPKWWRFGWGSWRLFMIGMLQGEIER